MAYYRQVSYAFWRAISNFSKALDKAFNATFLRRHKPGLLVWLRFNGKHGYMKIRGIHNFWIWAPIHVYLQDTITMTYTITDVDTGKDFASFAGTFAFDQELVRQKLLHTGYSYYDNILTEAVWRPTDPEEDYPIVYLLEVPMSKQHEGAKQVISYQRDIARYRPNHYACETCPEWDDVNGCWQGYDDWRKCDFDNENELPLEGEAWEDYNAEID